MAKLNPASSDHHRRPPGSPARVAGGFSDPDDNGEDGYDTWAVFDYFIAEAKRHPDKSVQEALVNEALDELARIRVREQAKFDNLFALLRRNRPDEGNK